MYSQEVPKEMTKAGIDIHYEHASSRFMQQKQSYTFLIQILNSYEELTIMFIPGYFCICENSWDTFFYNKTVLAGIYYNFSVRRNFSCFCCSTECFHKG